MRSRILLNGFLLLLAIGLGIVVFWDRGRDQADPAMPLTELDPQEVSRIRVEAPERTPVELEKDGDTWKLVSPFRLPANGVRARALADAAAARSRGRFPESDLELEEFGLDPPRVKLQLNDLDLLFGDTDPLKGRRYVLVDGTVHLIADTFFHHLTAAPPAFVHLAPLGPDPQITALTLLDAELRRSEGEWTVSHQGPAISADALTVVVEAWRRAQAFSVKRWQDEQESMGAVAVSLDPDETIAFQVARAEGAVLLQRADLGIQYHLPPAVGERLLRLRAPQADSQNQGSGG